MTDMMISFVGYTIAVFIFGLAVGKLVEKIERFIHNHDDEHKDTKNDRR